MLYWHLRCLQCILVGYFKPHLKSPDEVIEKTFIANPFDSDWMNSIYAGRFLTYTDASRWELVIRLGFFGLSLKNKWWTIMGGQKLIYRKPILLFRKFKILIRLAGWDEKWFYVTHCFIQNDDTKCVVLCRLGIRNSAGLVQPGKIMESLNFSRVKMAPDWILDSFNSDLEILAKAKLKTTDIKNEPIQSR